MATILLPGTKAVRSAVTQKASGGTVINSVTLIDFDTGTDIVLPAAAGDKVEVGVLAQWAAEAVFGYLDVATVVSGSPVTYFSTGTGTPAGDNVGPWIGKPSVESHIGPPVILTLGSGDIAAAGTVTLRLRVKTNTATNKTLYSYAASPLTFTAKNLGSG